ncbi:MAG: Dam family site-specific DNA-(adenine-N6)-methyltransferase [Pseudomonadota bacterium]
MKQQPFNRPFLKWAGGKYRVLPRIFEKLPEGKRLIEPFVGSGAVFLNTDYSSYLLADINPDLINLYQKVQDHGESFVEEASHYFVKKNNTESIYYANRHRFNTTQDTLEKALLFLYLNRHGYNGLCRYSVKSGFNVPFGRYTSPYFPEKELMHFIEKSKKATFVCIDFVKTLQRARKGSVVYCDPPYVPLTLTANFTQYSKDGFNLEQQTLLAEQAKKLAQRGIPVLISNHATELTSELYVSAEKVSFPVRRFISCDSLSRVHAQELLALFKAC